MAMNVGTPSSGSGDPEMMMEINTTPLIDVMLVLLVMLIITIPIQLHSVDLEMPVGAPPSKQAKPEKFQIDIDAQGTVFWQDAAMSQQQLEETMTRAARMQPQPEVHIRPDKAAKYAVFANVLATSKRTGLRKIAVIGSEQFI